MSVTAWEAVALTLEHANLTARVAERRRELAVVEEALRRSRVALERTLGAAQAAADGIAAIVTAERAAEAMRSEASLGSDDMGVAWISSSISGWQEAWPQSFPRQTISIMRTPAGPAQCSPPTSPSRHPAR